MRNSVAALLLISLFPHLAEQKTIEGTQANPLGSCRYMRSSRSLAGYEKAGPYSLEHFHLTKGRTDLREFLWKHWHNKVKGIAEVQAGTVDRGTVKVLYVIQTDEQGHWGIDIEMDRPMDPPCVTFHVDSLIRVPIQNPNEDYPSQTLGLWPRDKLPSRRLTDSDVADAKLFRVVFILNNKMVGDAI